MKFFDLRKINAAIILTCMLINELNAIELVCNGMQPRNGNQKIISVNCTDRKEVIEILGAAWSTLRKEQIGGSTEDLCYNPYKKAKELHPSIPFENIAPTFFAQCNMALQYVK